MEPNDDPDRGATITLPDDLNGWTLHETRGDRADDAPGSWTGGPPEDPEQFTIRIREHHFYSDDSGGLPRYSASIDDSRISGIGGDYYPLAGPSAQTGVDRKQRYRHTDRAQFYVDLYAWMSHNAPDEWENPLYDDRIHHPPGLWELRKHRMTERLDEWEWVNYGQTNPPSQRHPWLKITVEGHRGGSSYGVSAYRIHDTKQGVYDRIEELPTMIPEEMTRERAILRATTLAEELPEHVSGGPDQPDPFDRLADGEWTPRLIREAFDVSGQVASSIYKSGDSAGDILRWNDNLDSLDELPGIGKASARELSRGIPKLEQRGVTQYQSWDQRDDEDEDEDEGDERTDGGVAEWRRFRDQVNRRVRDLGLGPGALPDRDDDDEEEKRR